MGVVRPTGRLVRDEVVEGDAVRVSVVLVVPARRAADKDVGQTAGGVVGVVVRDCDAVDGLGGRDDAAAVVGDEALDEDVDAT